MGNGDSSLSVRFLHMSCDISSTPPTGKNLVTGEAGYNYTGEFYFPCSTSHLKTKMTSVLLVASLELTEHR